MSEALSMNDFTKEELESIKNAMGCLNINKILKGKVPTDVELINKIQSMIDNYCEHENKQNGFLCQECVDCGRCC